MGKGNEVDAREMGSAPLAKADKPKNRFDSVFSVVLFKPANDSARVFTSDRDGGKSKKIANVQVEIAGTGGYIRGSIYAKQPKGAAKAHAEFSWFGANMQTCIVVEDAQAKAELDQWRKGVALRYAGWLKDNPQTAALVGAPVADVELDGVSL